MDVYFRLHGITFVWDQNKARTNPVKHKSVTFEQAAEAFFDPFVKVVDASRQGEARDGLIGLDTHTQWYLLVMVYLELEDETIRLISALKATRKEREEYET